MTTGDEFSRRFPGYMPEVEAAVFAEETKRNLQEVVQNAKNSLMRTHAESWHRMLSAALPLLVEHASDKAYPVEIEQPKTSLLRSRTETQLTAGWLVLQMPSGESVNPDSDVEQGDTNRYYVLTEDARFGVMRKVHRGIDAFHVSRYDSRKPQPLSSESVIDIVPEPLVQIRSDVVANPSLLATPAFADKKPYAFIGGHIQQRGTEIAANLTGLLGEFAPDFAAMLPPR